MKRETTAKIAMNIGMARGDRHWYDPDGDNIYSQPDEEAAVLSHYLATVAALWETRTALREARNLPGKW